MRSRWPVVTAALAALAAAAYAARKRKQQEEEGPSDYQRRIRAKKMAALEAEWARKRTPPPPPPSPGPMPSRSVEAKLQRLEAEDEHRWRGVSPSLTGIPPSEYL